MSSLDAPPILKVVGDSGAKHSPYPIAPMDEWTLHVEGAVERPCELTLEEIRALAPEFQNEQEIECVSASKISPTRLTRFRGVPFAALMEHVGLKVDLDRMTETSPCVRFISRAPGTCGPRSEPHWTALPLATCLDPEQGILIATHINGDPLPYRNGGPLRSVVGPSIFFYKAIKWLSRIEIVEEDLDEHRGTWEEYAGYHNRARTALNERSTPVMRVIVGIRVGPLGPEDATEEVPEMDWEETFDAMYAAHDFSRLVVSKMHKMFTLPKDFRGMIFAGRGTGGLYMGKIRDTSFASADFRGTHMQGCNLSLCKMTNVRFANEDGSEAANLDGGDFEGAFFNNAWLCGVSMREAYLTNTVFTSDFKPTPRVRGLDVRGAINLDERTAQWLRENGAVVD